MVSFLFHNREEKSELYAEIQDELEEHKAMLTKLRNEVQS